MLLVTDIEWQVFSAPAAKWRSWCHAQINTAADPDDKKAQQSFQLRTICWSTYGGSEQISGCTSVHHTSRLTGSKNTP